MGIIVGLIGIVIILFIVGFLFKRMGSGSFEDRQLSQNYDRNRVNLECASSVLEIDELKKEIDVLHEFIKSDPKMAVQLVHKMVKTSALLNYKYRIRPFLIEARDNISDFLCKCNDDYDPNNFSSICLALLNASDEENYKTFKDVLEQQITNINKRRR